MLQELIVKMDGSMNIATSGFGNSQSARRSAVYDGAHRFIQFRMPEGVARQVRGSSEYVGANSLIPRGDDLSGSLEARSLEALPSYTFTPSANRGGYVNSATPSGSNYAGPTLRVIH